MNPLRSVGRAYRAIVRRWRTRRLCRRLAACGPYFVLEGRAMISHPQQVRVGANVHLGDGLWAQTAGGLTIGDNVIISHRCTIHTVNHDIRYPDALPYGTRYIHKPVVIESHVWVGMDVIITPGSHIGEGAVIGMGAVVAGEIPPLAIAVGNPARVIKYRDVERFRRLKAGGYWLRKVRGIPQTEGWSAQRALRRWGEMIAAHLAREGFITTSTLTAEGVPWPEALLYAYARQHPESRFTLHKEGYLLYAVAWGCAQSDEVLSDLLDAEEVHWLHQHCHDAD